MKLEKLICPYCRENLVYGDIYKENEGEIVYGYVYCRCGEYPIVEGILYLRKTPINNNIIKKIKKGLFIESVVSLLKHWPVNMKGKIIRIISGFLSNDYNLVKNFNKFVFFNIMQDNNFGNYFKHRFSSETFWPVYPLIYLMDNKYKKKNILDFACGTGHSSYLISTYLEPEQLVCTDISFRFLFYLKKFFVEDADCICHDANNYLPFKDEHFDTIHTIDSFHYINEKKRLSREFERIMDPNGLLILSHLHNALQHNPGAGYPLRPHEWMSLFETIYPIAIPEKSIIENFIFHDKLDLKKHYSIDQLNSSKAIFITGSRRKPYDGLYKNIWKYITKKKNNLIINPIYNIKIKNNKIILKRHFPSEFYRNNYPITENYLPEKYVINYEISKNIKNRVLTLNEIYKKNMIEIDDMMKKYIIINAPEKYI